MRIRATLSIPIFIAVAGVALFAISLAAANSNADTPPFGSDLPHKAVVPGVAHDPIGPVVTATPTRAPTVVPANEDALARSLLLTLSDFPTGWKETPDTPDDTPAAVEACDIPSGGRTGRALTGTFGPNDLIGVTHTVATFDGPASLAASTALLKQQYDCLANAINSGAADSDTTRFKGASVVPTAFVQLGDRTLAFQIRFTAERVVPTGTGLDSISLYYTVVIVERGRIGFSLVAFSALFPINTSTMESLARKAAAKLPASDAPNEDVLARSLVLRLSDFAVPGWTETPDPSTVTPGVTSCGGPVPGRTGKATSPSFASPGASVSLSEEIEVYDTSGSAESSLALLKERSDCIVAAVNAGAFDTPTLRARATAGPLTLAALGDSSYARRVTLTVETIGQGPSVPAPFTSFIDTFAVRKGRITVILSAGTEAAALGPAALQSIAPIALAKLQ